MYADSLIMCDDSLIMYADSLVMFFVCAFIYICASSGDINPLAQYTPCMHAGAVCIGEGIAENDTLQHIELSSNPIGLAALLALRYLSVCVYVYACMYVCRMYGCTLC